MHPEAAQRRERWLARQPNWALEAYHTHAVVYRYVNEGHILGRSGEAIWCDIARVLLGQLQETREHLAKVQLIAPVRVKSPDGREWICHCPDELVPVTEL